jgi:hypothetical protein
VNVKGLSGGTGKYLVGFYLPGDTNGDGTVDKTISRAIKTLMGDNATNKNYNFDADVNRDGIINRKDLKLAQQELGATTKVSPVVSVNLDPASDPSLDRKTSFSIVHFAGTVSPGATVTFANNDNNGATTAATADAKGAYNIMVPLVSGSNTWVTTMDGFGQSIGGDLPVVTPASSTSDQHQLGTGSGTTTNRSRAVRPMMADPGRSAGQGLPPGEGGAERRERRSAPRPARRFSPPAPGPSRPDRVAR